MYSLLTKGNASPKIEKSNRASNEYHTAILYLAPYKLSGYNVCSQATNGCIKGCLNTAGRGVYDKIQQARLRRTKFLFENRIVFLETLNDDIQKFKNYCTKRNLKPALRLNGTSDLFWESISDIIQSNPTIQFYDYTKVANRMDKFLRGEMPANYYLTFSLAENNLDKALDVVYNGGTAAAVFRNKNIPTQWLGLPVFNGDKTDLRFLDPKGCWIGLYAKGKMKKDDSNFVVEN